MSQSSSSNPAVLHLHQRRVSDYIPDHDGAEFDSLDAARDDALGAARYLISNMALSGVVDLSASFVGGEGPRLIVQVSVPSRSSRRAKISLSDTVADPGHALRRRATASL